jgi:ABC-type Fe3+-citrate transport system substrate-binding protein
MRGLITVCSRVLRLWSDRKMSPPTSERGEDTSPSASPTLTYCSEPATSAMAKNLEAEKRIAELLGKKKELANRVAQLTAEVDALLAREQEREHAAAAARAERRQLFESRVEAFKKECPDFEQVLGEADLQWPGHVLDLLEELPNGPEMMYVLAVHGHIHHEEILRSPASEALHKMRKLALLYELDRDARRQRAIRENVTSVYQRERQALNEEKRWRN